MVYRKSPQQVAHAQRVNIGIDPAEGAEEKVPKAVSVVGGGQGGSLIAFTQGSSVGHGY